MSVRDEALQSLCMDDDYFRNCVSTLLSARDKDLLSGWVEIHVERFFCNTKYNRFLPEIIQASNPAILIPALRPFFLLPDVAWRFPFVDMTIYLSALPPPSIPLWMQVLELTFSAPQLEDTCAANHMVDAILCGSQPDILRALVAFLVRLHRDRTTMPAEKERCIKCIFQRSMRVFIETNNPTLWASTVGCILWTRQLRPMLRLTFSSKECNDLAAQWLLGGHFVMLTYWKWISPHELHHALLQRMGLEPFWRTNVGRTCIEQWIKLQHRESFELISLVWEPEMAIASRVALTDPHHETLRKTPIHFQYFAKVAKTNTVLQAIAHFVDLQDTSELTSLQTNLYLYPDAWQWLQEDVRQSKEYTHRLLHVLVNAVQHNQYTVFSAVFDIVKTLVPHPDALFMVTSLATVSQTCEGCQEVYQWLHEQERARVEAMLVSPAIICIV